MKSLKVGLTNGRVWERITALARQNAKKSFVPVAYFGANGAALLPLSKGSWLAVDASEAAVKSGQTCPTALIKLQRNGVRIFSVNHLHAKLFVFGRIGIVGSANASANSANLLIESTITFTSSRDVNAAIRFIRDDCCLLELEPERLVQLSKLYRPPLSAGSRSNKRVAATLRIAQLKNFDDYESDPAFERGKRNAAKKFSRDSDFESFSFQWTGACPFKDGDKIIQVSKESADRYMVNAPASVVHIEPKHSPSRQRAFIYLQGRRRRRIELGNLCKRLGRGARKKLSRSGRVAAGSFYDQLLRALRDSTS